VKICLSKSVRESNSQRLEAVPRKDALVDLIERKIKRLNSRDGQATRREDNDKRSCDRRRSELIF